ncbi:MAG TPA: hypothetical protein VF791_04175 [Pyrinomonadaceae bacterium]
MGIRDELIAIDIDQAGMVCVEHYRDKKEEMKLNALIAGVSTRVLSAFAGDGGDDSSQSSDVSYGDDGPAIYVDGEYRGGGERMKMSEADFIKRTATAPAMSQYGYETRGTPRIINKNDPDVV